MNLASINRLFNQANTLQLLRDKNAVLALAFLKEAFGDGKKSIAREELISLLADYLEQWTELEPFDEQEEGEIPLFERYRNRARRLLRDWESRDKRYLRGDNNAEGRYEYSLTEHPTRAWQWLETLEQREFSGARSRLDDIFEKMRRVIENSREKTDADRIAELTEKQQELQRQITDIQSGKSPYKPFDAVRIQEEYDGLLEQVRALSTDFKAVESNFERIRTDILRKQATQDGSKGALLGSMLDARDELDRTPQGISFNAFFEELRDAQRQQQFANYVQELINVLEEHEIAHDSDRLLTRLHRHLLSEARPVMDANRRIADRISRMMAQNTAHDRQLLKERIAAIKAAVLDPDFANSPINLAAPFWEIGSDRAAVKLPLEKKLNPQPDESAFRFAMPQSVSSDRPELALDGEELITTRLNAHLADALETFGQMTLLDLLKKHPLNEGLAEVLAYLSIVAAPDNRHFIDPGEQDLLPLDSDGNEQFLQGARVFFVK